MGVALGTRANKGLTCAAFTMFEQTAQGGTNDGCMEPA